ncbi:MAG: DegV family protein [Erysipelotrichales bacterium]
MKVKLVVDSTIAYTVEEAKEHDVAITPFHVMYQDKNLLDCVDILPEEFYELQERGVEASTSQPNVANTMGLFSELLKEYDHIVYCVLPAELSGTYNAGMLAASEIDPNRITVIDIKTGLGALRHLDKIVKNMVKENKTLEEIIEKCSRLKYNSHAFFMPYDTKQLHRSGRFGNMAASIFSMIKLKLSLQLTQEGYIDKFAISRTEAKLYREMVKKAKEEGFNGDNTIIYLIDTNYADKIKELRSKLEEDFKGAQFEYMYLSPTLGSHIGPKTYSIQFVKKEWS